jgi:hypothetical protein
VRLEVTGVGGPAAAAVNVYRGGHWVVATSIAGDEDAPEGGLALPPLEPGVHHIQAQASAFDPQGAGVAVVCAYPAGDTAEACLLALTGDTRVRSRSDAFAEQLRAGATLTDADTAFRFLAHEHARDLFALPFPSSGIEQVAYGVDERVSWSRIVVAIAIILMGLVAASIVLRRAREGANLADAVLARGRLERGRAGPDARASQPWHLARGAGRAGRLRAGRDDGAEPRDVARIVRVWACPCARPGLDLACSLSWLLERLSRCFHGLSRWSSAASTSAR